MKQTKPAKVGSVPPVKAMPMTTKNKSWGERHRAGIKKSK